MTLRNLRFFAVFFILFSVMIGSCFAQNVEKRKIKIMGNRSLPPYEYFNRDFEPIGYNIDLIKEIMSRLDIPYEIQLDTWSNVIDSLNKGKVDLVVGMMYNTERGEMYKFGVVHTFLNFSIVARKGDNVNSFQDLNGSTIILQKGSNCDNILTNHNVAANIFYVDNILQGFNMVINNEADYMISPEETARVLLTLRGEDKLNIVNVGFSPREYRFVSKDKELISKINKEFYAIKSNGTYNIIHNNWFS